MISFSQTFSYPFLRVSLGRTGSGQRSLKDGIHHRTTERAQPKKWSSTPQQTCTTRDQTSPLNHTLQTTLKQTQSATLYGRPITTDQTQTTNSPAIQTTTDHQTSPTQTTIQNTTDQPQPPQTTTDQTSPTQTTTLHPTLLEKLRVGSPTSQHTQFSAINNKLSRKVSRDNIHAIQQTSPFPKLPAYYTNEMTSPKIPKPVTKETNGTNKKSEGIYDRTSLSGHGFRTPPITGHFIPIYTLYNQVRTPLYVLQTHPLTGHPPSQMPHFVYTLCYNNYHRCCWLVSN